MVQFQVTLHTSMLEEGFADFRDQFNGDLYTDSYSNFINIAMLLFLANDYNKEDLVNLGVQKYTHIHHDDLDNKQTVHIRLHEEIVSSILNFNNKKKGKSNTTKMEACFPEVKSSTSAIVSKFVELAIVDFLEKSCVDYANMAKPLYSFAGSKTLPMAKAHKHATNAISLNPHTELIEVCVGSGALFFATDTTNFTSCTVNDLTPSRVNFLSVVQVKPLELIYKLLDLSSNFKYFTPEEKTKLKTSSKSIVDAYDKKQRKYKKIKIDVDVAYALLVYETFNTPRPFDSSILKKITNFPFNILPMYFKLKDVAITKLDARHYLSNSNTNKFVCLDVPYITSTPATYSGIKDFDYVTFHSEVSKALEVANYPFLYYCRSTSSQKINSLVGTENGLDIMSKCLKPYFFNKGFFFDLVPLEVGNGTEHEHVEMEVMISNRKYNDTQFQWDRYETLLEKTKAKLKEQETKRKLRKEKAQNTSKQNN